jgi:KDO2-lipid IV(A) lauroyltransferase
MVFKNLQNSFPEKLPKEIEKIAQQFYLHLADLMIESIKSVSMSQKSFNKRYKMKNWHEIQDRLQQGKNLLLVSPHTGNWEWVFSLVYYIPAKVYAIYHPLSNPYFDSYIRQTRQRYGAVMISMKETFKRILESYEKKEQILSWFAADQACHPEKAHWATFLGQDTTFHAGYEAIAKETEQAVLFLDIKKVKRGHYELELIPICDNPQDMPQDSIVNAFITLTEKRIRETPAYWLWSHNRWKHHKNGAKQS